MPEPDPLPAIKTPWGSATTSPGTPAGGQAAPSVTVPDHALIRKIGRGAYGEVWLAKNALGQFRAVKVLHRSAFAEDRPFEREFAGIQRFEPLSRSHESQLNILHVGRGPDYFYYVMELADDMGRGTTIDEASYTPRNLRSELLLRGRLPVDECIRLGLALTTALEHLHRHGLVHRDIKPSNIVFVNGIPKLADIGLVAQAERTMSFVGTEGYLPPEGPGTVQADLFSLGKVLYEISTGQDRQQFPDLPTNVVELPDRGALAEFNEVLVRACAPDVKQRYQTSAEMHADLALLQSGKSVSRMRAVERRLKLVARAGAIVTALAGVIAAGWLWQARQTKQVRELAEENRNRIVRLDIANGVHLLDEGDPAGALLWFADALPLVTNNAAEESVHRVRIQQTLNQIPQQLLVLPHTNSVVASAMSDDGRRIATGTDSGCLRVWDATTGMPLWNPLSLGVDPIAQARFTLDGRFVFASSLAGYGFRQEESSTNIATLIETESGRTIVRLSGTNWLRADLSPDSRWLVTGDTHHVIRVHDASNGKRIAEFSGHTNRIIQFSFSENGDILASSSEDHTVRLWHLPSGEALGPAIPYDRGAIRLSEDGRRLVTATIGPAASTIRTRDVLSGKSDKPPIEMRGSVTALMFVSRNEHRLYVATDQKCALFDLDTHRQVLEAIQPPPDSPFYSVSPDGRRVAFGGPKGLTGVWSLETGELLLPPCLRDRQLTDVNFSPDGAQLLATSAGGTAMLINSYFLREDASYLFDETVEADQPRFSMECRRFSPDRRYLLLIAGDKTVHQLDLKKMTAQDITAPEFRDFQALQATFDDSGHRRAIWYSRQGTNLVELWSEQPGGTNRFVLSLPAGPVSRFVFTPDGNHLITSARDGQVRFWRTANGALERTVAVETVGEPMLFLDGSTAFGVSPATRRFALFDLNNGNSRGTPMPPFNLKGIIASPVRDRFASAGSVNWSRVWSMRTGEPLTPLLNHGGEVRCVEWNSDGTRLLTAGLTPEVKIWDAITGEQLFAPLRLGTKSIETAQWSLDDRLIVARNDEKAVRVWDATTGESVTPALRHRGYARAAYLVADNRLVTTSLPNRLRAWNLQPCSLSLGALTDYAMLLSGRRLSAVGVMHQLTPDELWDLSRSLKHSHAALFSVPSEQVQVWHRSLVDAPTTPTRIESGLFHLNCLAQAAPDDTWTKHQLARFHSCEIPPRDPKISPRLLDLSPFYTHSLDGTYRKQFSELPRGLQTLAGTAFDVRGIVRLESVDASVNSLGSVFELSPMPTVNGIAVAQRCRALHFLQGVDWGTQDGKEIARWVFHYADGTQREWPLIYNHQVRDSWWRTGEPKKPADGIVAWEAPTVETVTFAEKVCLFKSTWTNPVPEVEIKSLDFVVSTPMVCPFVVAITAE